SLPAGAVAGWGLHPLEKRRLVTAHVETGPSHLLRFVQLMTQTRLFGPPRGCRSHCLVRDSGAQPECLERRSGSCATSPLEEHLVALAVQGRQQIVEDAGFPLLDLGKSRVMRRVGSR